MADDLAMRTCRRTGCRWPAAASLSYRYATRQVWLLDLVEEPDPSLYDLCPHHADSLTVPRGWERVDQRTRREAVREPSGRELTDGGRRGSGGDYQPNRYAELSAELPRLAREAAGEAEEPGSPPGDADKAGTNVPAPAMPSRDLAPLPVEGPAAAGDQPAPGPRPGPDESDDHDGQLAIPVDEVDRVDDEAVVVSIELAGARRRGGGD